MTEPELRLAPDEDDGGVRGDGSHGGRPLLQRREERRRVRDLVAEEDGVGRAAGVLPGLVVTGGLGTWSGKSIRFSLLKGLATDSSESPPFC